MRSCGVSGAGTMHAATRPFQAILITLLQSKKHEDQERQREGRTNKTEPRVERKIGDKGVSPTAL